MKCIHYEACGGKQTSIGNGSSVIAYNAVSALAVFGSLLSWNATY